jgi:DNA helicase II / ATP-dependent DNA helicase PcrA
MTADLIEVLNFDDKSDSKREVVDQSLLSDIRTKIRKAGDELRANHLPRLVTWCKTCERCDMAGLCRKRGG